MAVAEGELCLSTGKYEEAIKYFHEHLNQCKETSKHSLSCMLNIGACLIALSRYVEGRSALTNVLSLMEGNKEYDPVIAAEVHYNLAIAASNLNDHAETIKQLKNALELFKEAGNNEMAGDIYLQLADCYEDIHQKVTSLHCALDQYKDIKHKEAGVALQLVTLYNASGDSRRCQQMLAQARLLIFTTESSLQSGMLLKLGLVYGSLKMMQEALECFEKALSLLHQSSSMDGSRQLQHQSDILKTEAALLQNIGAIYNELKKFNESMVYHRDAATANEKLQLHEEEVKCLCNLGFAQAQVQEYSTSVNTFSVAVSKAKKLNNRLLIVQSLEGLGSALYHLKQYSESQLYFEKALTIVSANKKDDSGLAKERLMEKISDVVEIQKAKESSVHGLMSTTTDDDYIERVTEYFSNIDSSNNSSSANISVFGSPTATSGNVGVGFGSGVREGCLALGRSAKETYVVKNGEIHQTGSDDTPVAGETRTQERNSSPPSSSSSSFCIIL